jgi:hypothetical protein
MSCKTPFLMVVATLPIFLAARPIGPAADRFADSLTTAPDFYLQLGDLLTARYRYAAARMRYEMAADLDRIDGILPVEAMRRIANTHYFEGDYGKARQELVALAAEAAEAGEWETQLWALADAAWLADLAEDEASFELHLEQCEALLNSHNIPGARYKLRTLLRLDFRAFAPHLESW